MISMILINNKLIETHFIGVTAITLIDTVQKYTTTYNTSFFN